MVDNNNNELFTDLHLRHSHKKKEDDHLEENSSIKASFKIGKNHKLIIFLLSLLLTATTVVIPFFSKFATDVQSLNLYTGQMVLNGQLPYADIFATGGFLYYILIAAGFAIGNPLWLLIIQLIAFYVSGIYLYKLVEYYIDNKSISLLTCAFFYLSNLALGFGGLYPIQWAMPFVLLGLWFITKHFDNVASDEGFIAYGLYIAIALLLEPQTLILWLIIFVILTGYNISKKLWARGFYQSLATLLGLILIFYTAGYFIFNMELLLPYLSQTLGYHLTTLHFGNGSWWQVALLQIGLSLLSGILIGILGFIEHIRKVQFALLPRFILFITTIIYLTRIILSKNWSWHLLLLALPFGLILTVITIDKVKKQRNKVTNSHRRKEDEPSFVSTFLFTNLGGPILLAFIGLALPIYQYYQYKPVITERLKVVSYITENSAPDERIIVVDNSATIFKNSKRQSATHYPVTSLYLADKHNKADFEDEFLGNQADLIVVSKKEKLSQNIKDGLSKYYLEVTPDNFKQFKIYNIK